MFYAKAEMVKKMNMKLIIKAGLCSMILLGLPFNGIAQYKDYVRKETKNILFTISFDKNHITVLLPTDSESISISANFSDIVISPNEVKIIDKVIFTADRITVQAVAIPYDRISDVQLSSDNGKTNIEFFELTSALPNVKKMREGNIISFSDSITIKKEEFIRGLVFSVEGPVTVVGEVNKDIISLFSDIKLVTGSVSRGNIVSITGKITVEKNASVYGEMYSGIKNYDSRRFRFYRDNEFEVGLMTDYNRIDGLTIGATVGYTDGDSSLPSVETGVGYAMASERPRHFIKASQVISKKRGVSVSAEYYRKLASDDDWLLSNLENAVFVVLATEDFKDYYETEGFAGWLNLKLNQDIKLKAGYQYDDTRWRPAKTHLWSLFGGNKLFRENFSSVDEVYREIGITELESTKSASILLSAEYESKEFGNEFANSGWLLKSHLDWSSSDIGSDFDYRRYSFSAVRYQKLTKHTALRIRGIFSNSDRNLPMYKRYFLGGFGTMRGYRHKEFMGSRYWMTNLEFWLSLPAIYNSYLVPFWDICQIANDSKLNDDAEVKNDIGLGVRITGIRLDLAKRLDGADDKDPRIYVRFSKTF